jgi:hypothetical protein
VYADDNERILPRVTRRLRVLTLLLAFALTPVLTTARVSAQTSGNQSGQETVNSWALTPCGDDPSQPGERTTFSYTLAPGATQADCLTVWNYGNTQLTFHVYAADALNNASGAFDLVDEGAKSKDAGSWVQVGADWITLPASSSVRLPVTIAVPANASPGDHTAGLVAASQTPGSGQGGGQVLLNRRVGSRVYLRITGPTNPALTTENLSTDYHSSLNPLDGSLDVTYTIRNNGNIRLGAKQKIAVHDVFGDVADRTPKAIPELLPGNSVTITEHFTGIAATLRVSADVTIEPFVPGATGKAAKSEAQTTTASISTWAIPWSLLLLLLVILVIVWIARRRRNAAGSGDVPPSDPASPAPSPEPPVGAAARSGPGRSPFDYGVDRS